MSDITTELERFFEPLADDEEGQETLSLQLAPRTFLFDLADADPFVLTADDDSVAVEWEDIDDPDLINEVTRVEGSVDALHDIMAGRIRPLDSLDDGEIFMTSQMTARCYNYGLLRAFRRAAELAEATGYQWEG